MPKWKKGLPYNSAEEVLKDLFAGKIIYWKHKAYSPGWLLSFHIRELQLYSNFSHAIEYKKNKIIQTDLFGRDEYAKDIEQ